VVSGPLGSIKSLSCDVCSKKDHFILSNTTAAAECSVPDWSMSYYIVPPVKNQPPCDVAFSRNSLTICCYLLFTFLLLVIIINNNQ